VAVAELIHHPGAAEAVDILFGSPAAENQQVPLAMYAAVVLHTQGGLIMATAGFSQGQARYSQGTLPVSVGQRDGQFVGMRDRIKGPINSGVGELVIVEDEEPESLRDAGAESLLLTFHNRDRVRLPNGEEPSVAALNAGFSLVRLIARSFPRLETLPPPMPVDEPLRKDFPIGTIADKHTGERWFKPIPS
jgi:hypothetical protein